MEQLDLNDIRLTLGTIHGNVKRMAEQLDRLTEKVDDYGALAATSARIVALVDDAETTLGQFPGALRGLAEDPTIGMFLGDPLRQLAADLESVQKAARERRTAAPEIERG